MVFVEVSNSAESGTSRNGGNHKQKQAIEKVSVSCVKVIDLASSLFVVCTLLSF